MSYFNNVPMVSYPITSTKTGVTSNYTARNILVRARILQNIKDATTTYLTYSVRDGERPEHLAKRIYGRSDLHWIILMFNDIIDPMFQWPLSSNEVTNIVDTRYSGVAYFIDMKNPLRGGDDFWFEVGTKITISGSSSTPIVSEWNPDLYKIVVPSGSPTTTASKVITQTRSDGKVVSATVKRVVADNRYAVHHFVNSDTGETEDHHTLASDPDRFFNASTEEASVLDRYILGNEVLTLPSTISGQDSITIVPVTNYEYEISENDSKRQVKVMRSQLVDQIIKDMRAAFLVV
jgi:hypothetical protein